MPAVVITPVTMTPSGYNLTDSAAFSTLVLGSGNGVKALISTGTLVLKNDSGSSATFTILVAPTAQLTALGLTTPNLEVVVANNKQYVLPISAAMLIGGYVTIECSVAGKVLILI